MSVKNLRKHEDTNVRLMVEFLNSAIKAAKKGNIKDVCTHVRLASSFEKDVPPNIRLNKEYV